MDQNSQNIVLINNRLAYLNFNVIFEFLGQFNIIFQEGFDNFETEHKTC